MPIGRKQPAPAIDERDPAVVTAVKRQLAEVESLDLPFSSLKPG